MNSDPADLHNDLSNSVGSGISVWNSVLAIVKSFQQDFEFSLPDMTAAESGKLHELPPFVVEQIKTLVRIIGSECPLSYSFWEWSFDFQIVIYEVS